jgi:3'-phosphoadenosine 5'-phosphosulfate sulfotransferase (PAPS reductase)/FAD synthetase
VNDAHAVVVNALTRFGEPAAVGVSGGKDSVAMCHIVAQHCRPTIIWNDSGLELPDSEQIVNELATQLGLQVIVARGVDALARKMEIGAEAARAQTTKTDSLCIIGPVRKALTDIAAKVEFVGLRKAESKRRRAVISKYGPMYDSKRWGCGIAWPMRHWQAADIFAYIDAHRLPLHPAYTRTQWQERDSIRVSWAWDSNRENQGDIEYLRRFYPQIFSRIRQIEGVY